MLHRSNDFGTTAAPALPASTRRADARALAGRIAPAAFTAEGVTWLAERIEVMPTRGRHVEVLTPEQAVDFIEADAQVELPHEVVVTVRRRSPRRGVVSVHAVIDLAIARPLRAWRSVALKSKPMGHGPPSSRPSDPLGPRSKGEACLPQIEGLNSMTTEEHRVEATRMVETLPEGVREVVGDDWLVRTVARMIATNTWIYVEDTGRPDDLAGEGLSRSGPSMAAVAISESGRLTVCIRDIEISDPPENANATVMLAIDGPLYRACMRTAGEAARAAAQADLDPVA